MKLRYSRNAITQLVIKKSFFFTFVYRNDTKTLQTTFSQITYWLFHRFIQLLLHSKNVKIKNFF